MSVLPGGLSLTTERAEVKTRDVVRFMTSDIDAKEKSLVSQSSLILSSDLIEFLKNNIGARVGFDQLVKASQGIFNSLAGKVESQVQYKNPKLLQFVIQTKSRESKILVSHRPAAFSGAPEIICIRNLYAFKKPLQDAMGNGDEIVCTYDQSLELMTRLEVILVHRKRLKISNFSEFQEKEKPGELSRFYVDVRFVSDFSERQMQIFNDAAKFWENIIEGIEQSRLPDDEESGITILVNSVDLDGPDRTLAQAKPTHLREYSLLPTTGIMEFDTADLERMNKNGALFDVVCHEMGHVLGIGTLWEQMGLLKGVGTDDPGFIGQHAMLTYAKLMGFQHPMPVPVENHGGKGSQDLHWRETSLDNELMTSVINDKSNPISTITLAALKDMGYRVNTGADITAGM